jgi:hypothetical protein
MHGYTTVVHTKSAFPSLDSPFDLWYTRIDYDDGRIVEFYTTECIASEGRF